MKALPLLFALWLQAPLPAAGTLDIYLTDCDHGNALLLVTPNGKSLLFDASQPGEVYANRILSVARQAGLKQIDYVVISHYDWDHYGTVPLLAEKLPILNYVDHGRNIREIQTAEQASHDKGGHGIDKLFLAYAAARAKGNHIVAQPGTRIELGPDIDLRIVASGGKVLLEPLPGAGGPNPACAATGMRTDDPSEDGQSVSRVVTYGKFRFADFGDLTWNKSYRLFCPLNMVGHVDAYVVTHHGLDIDLAAAGIWDWSFSSAPPAEVAGLSPRVALLSAGEDFVGRVATGQALERVRKSSGLEDLWQIHYVGEAGPENNSAENFIANMSTVNDQSHYIKLSAQADGSFTVTNSRNGFTKRYSARKEAKR
jgi:beta-lactamase superfamily II metal-dependent hydrolase